MPVRKQTGRVDLRIDEPTSLALKELLEIHAGKKNQSDIIREAILEKLERDRRKRPKNTG